MKLLTIEETSVLLRVKISTLYSWVHNKKIPFKKLNGRLIFVYAELIEFVMNGKIA